MLASELCKKEVVNSATGDKLGYVDDIIFDTETATVQKIVIYKQRGILGLFSKSKDIEILWQDISIIGADTIIINIKNC